MTTKPDSAGNTAEAVASALSSLDTLSELWAARVDLPGMSANIARAAPEKLADAIEAIAKQAYVEGAYDHHCAAQDGNCEHPAKPAQDGAGIEAAAKAIYELMPFVEANGQPAIGVKPPWYSDGNSNKQEEARRYARAALAAGRAEVSGE